MKKQDARKNRGKIVITVICLILILFAMGFGVYAVVSGKTDIQGTVTYYANSVTAGVYGHIEGYELGVGDEPIADFSANFSPNSPQGTTYNWDIGNVMFAKDSKYWQNRIDAQGKENLNVDKQPTITIRIAIFNYAVYDEKNQSNGNLYIGNFTAPLKHNNLEYTYRMGYGTLDGSNYNWKSSWQQLSTLETFTIQDREYLFAENVYLNDAEDNLCLKARESNEGAMNVYILDFKIRVQNESEPINEFLTNLRIGLSSTEFATIPNA